VPFSTVSDTSWRYRRSVARVEDGGPNLQAEVLGALPDFWDGRDVRHLHHPVWFRQFSDAALAVRAPDGTLGGYLLGCLTQRVVYVHVVAVRPSMRGMGVARNMYEVVLARAARLGLLTVEAITTPGNAASLAFHRSLGFTATLTRDYAGSGQDRVLFVRPSQPLPEG
jgi:GNAT superfamily N-acetyltransferase